MKKFLYILGVSFVFSFALLLLTREPMQPDSYGYDSIGFNLAKGHGYVDDSRVPAMGREPAYPAFLALIYLLFDHDYFFVQLAQIILFLLTAIFVYKTARLIFCEKIAVYSMAITALFPTLANYPAYILSETLFTFLLSVLVFSCIKIYFTNRTAYYLLAGGMLGITALCKAVMLPFIFILILWLIFLRFKSGFRAGFIIKIAVMTMAFVILTIPWMARNYLKCGSFSLRGGSETPLCVKVQKLDYGFNDFKQNLVFIMSENLGKRVFPDIVDNPRDFLHKEDDIAREKILPELEGKGYSPEEIKNIMISKIMKRPVKFIAVSFLDLLKMTQFTYLSILIDQRYLIDKITNLSYGNSLLSLIRGVFRSLAYILILLSICGMLIKKDMWRKWIFLFLLICYTNLIYSLIYGYGRYGVPLIPYYIILSAPMIVAVEEKMKGMIKCQK
ncbi:MAG: glycosyltransferase family 39 protein [Candidatus Omnitrophota bacterium]|nr:glycosyltransferase family 39 protein [Candidatus Omnitrophota bacterium]